MLKEFWRKLYSPSRTAAAVDPSPVNHSTRPGQDHAAHQAPTAAYNLSLLQEMVGDNSPALREIVQKFVRDTPLEVDRLEKAALGYDLRAIGVQAHKLKAHLKLFGLESAAHSLSLMEGVGKGELPPGNPAVLQQHARKVKAVFEGAIGELAKAYPAT